MSVELLKAKMAELDMNQAELAEKSGLSRSAISQYISGVNAPTEKNLRRLADALGCNLSDLAEGTERAHRPGLSISEAAKKCGKSPAFIAGWIQEGTCPFGYARKGTGEKWDYLIPAGRLESWLEGRTP